MAAAAAARRATPEKEEIYGVTLQRYKKEPHSPYNIFSVWIIQRARYYVEQSCVISLWPVVGAPVVRVPSFTLNDDARRICGVDWRVNKVGSAG